MVNVKSKAYEILSDERITDIVNDVFEGRPNTVENFPCVAFVDGGQEDLEYADNHSFSTEYRIEVHIFTKALEGYPTTSDVGSVIDDVMKENDFTCAMNIEAPDADDSVRHRVMEYRNYSF